MKNILRKIVAFVISVAMLSSMTLVTKAESEYSVEDAYYECTEIYPEFVDALKAQPGVTDAKIVTFLETLQGYLLGLEVEITEDNFEEYLIEAIQEAVTLRKNIAVRDAILAAFPEAAVDGMDGIIHEDFIPIVETVKNIIFTHGLLGDEDASEEETESETETKTETESETETEAETESESESESESETESETETEAETETETESETEAETEKKPGNVTGGNNGNSSSKDEDDSTEEPEDEKATNTVTTPAVAFKDMTDTSYGIDAVKALVAMGIINGYEDGTFRPNNPITRAEFAKIIVLASGRYDAKATCSFTDVKTTDWFYSYVASAKNLGFIKGRSDTIFDPNSNITRADLCTIVYRYVKSINSEFKASGEAKFVDVAQVPEYAREAVTALYSKGIAEVLKDNKFEPLTPATRAQSAKIIHGAIKVALGM